MYAHLKSDIEELLPRDSPSVRALDEMRRRIPGLQFLAVVVDTGTDAQISAGEKLLDDLAARIRTYPAGMVRDVRTGMEAERRFVEMHAPLYVDLPDLQEILQRIVARRDFEVERESGALLDDGETPPSIDTSDIERKYDARISGKEKGSARFSDSKEHVSLLILEVGEFTTGAAKSRALLERVQADVKALGGTQAYAPGMRVGYASDVAISVEELDALESDLSVSTVLVAFAEIAVIVLYYRWWRSLLVLLPPLLLATVYAFGVASLPPASVTELNSNTAFLGSIIVGNGVNVGIVLLARYREARQTGLSVDDALVVGVWGARLGTLAASLAAGCSYASLILTEFRGFRQFGFIGGAGMVASWVTAFVLGPPLIRWVDREGPGTLAPTRRRHGIMDGVVSLVERWPVAIVSVGSILLILSIATISRFDASSELEHDFSKLRRVDTWSTGDGYWGRKVNALLGRYVTPTLVMSDSVPSSVAAEKAIRGSMEHEMLSTMVAFVRGASDVLPDAQDAKMAVVREIREALTPKIRSLIPDGKRANIDAVLGPEDLRRIEPSEIPPGLVSGLRERDGTIGRTVLVYPKPSEMLWRAKEIGAFVNELRDDASTGLGPNDLPGRVAGSIPLSHDIITSIGRDAPLASLVSFLGVIGVVLLVLQVGSAALYVIGSLAVGVLWLGAATMLLHIKINFCNFVAFPITFGIGVDYAVNVIARYVQDGSDDVGDAVRRTGAAVGMCSLTTIIGYSSLLVAKNRALYLFGLTAVLGELACLTTAVIVLPALLVAVRHWKMRRNI